MGLEGELKPPTGVRQRRKVRWKGILERGETNVGWMGSRRGVRRSDESRLLEQDMEARTLVKDFIDFKYWI